MCPVLVGDTSVLVLGRGPTLPGSRSVHTNKFVVIYSRFVGKPHLALGALAECIGTPQAIANRAIAST
jgi:hypothetical protein